MSRPTASQWPRRTSILWVITLERAHRVPHVGVAGDRPERLLLAAAADHDRQVGLDRQRAVAQVVERVVAARRRGDRLAVEQPAASRRPIRRASRAAGRTRCRSRCRGPCAPSSIHAPPMPRIARPSLTWSSVATVLATSPGLRNVLAPTRRPEPGLLGLAGPGVEQRPALEDRLVRVAEDRVEVVPRPEVGVAEAVDPLGGVEHLGPGRRLAPEQDPELDVGHGVGLRAGRVEAPSVGVGPTAASRGRPRSSSRSSRSAIPSRAAVAFAFQAATSARSPAAR